MTSGSLERSVVEVPTRRVASVTLPLPQLVTLKSSVMGLRLANLSMTPEFSGSTRAQVGPGGGGGPPPPPPPPRGGGAGGVTPPPPPPPPRARAALGSAKARIAAAIHATLRDRMVIGLPWTEGTL